MKKLLLGSVSLLIFSLSIAIFQISCKKDATAQTTNTGLTQLNKILYTKYINATSLVELWTANYDGTNQQKINISLPAGQTPDGTSRLSPDGTKVFFGVRISGTSVIIYSANLDGSDLTSIINGSTTNTEYGLCGSY